jgi:hypothetical protein
MRGKLRWMILKKRKRDVYEGLIRERREIIQQIEKLLN